MTDERRQRIVDVIRALGPGEVTTYGDIAEVAGYPGRSRLVGHILASSTDEDDLPWWRVVNAAGRLVPGHERTQAAMLRAERVRVRNGHVVERAGGPLPLVSSSAASNRPDRRSRLTAPAPRPG